MLKYWLYCFVLISPSTYLITVPFRNISQSTYRDAPTLSKISPNAYLPVCEYLMVNFNTCPLSIFLNDELRMLICVLTFEEFL